LPLGFSLGMMTEVDWVRDGDGQDYHPESINSLTVGHDLVGKLSGYLEFWSDVSTERRSSWQGSIDFGLAYPLTDNMQIDAGINIGVTRAADDVNPFIGFSWRF